MSLDAILSHILEAAASEKARIISEAKEQARESVRLAGLEADKLYREISDKHKAAAEAEKNRLLVNARLEQRTKMLAVKQELMREVFSRFGSGLKAEQLRKKQVTLDGVKDSGGDAGFYLARIRQDYESKVAEIIFG